ncbi:MAG: bifunctional methylenetetrahydrofolate dehydrogenase/methenyltetrahydrofolate cyclohydrolase FolD [Elusimicrobiota bacterium]
MSAEIINGKEIARQIREELKSKVEKLKTRGVIPGLATILVGDDPASQVYIGQKVKVSQELGVYSEHHHLGANISESQLLELIHRLNNSPKIHGILCQLPLPKGLNADKVLLAISPDKDVDGFHPVNMGKLLSKKSWAEIIEEKIFIPCTPAGIIELLQRSGTVISGKEAVVLGRSNIVGKPVALLLLSENATVTICHSQTKDLAAVCRRADILIAAIGKPKFVTENMVKEGAVVIDVGVNRLPEGLCGDVDLEGVKGKVQAITPVPGGVGPMTITMLMANTIRSAEK